MTDWKPADDRDHPVLATVYEDEFCAWVEQYAVPRLGWWQFVARFRRWRTERAFVKRIKSVWNGKWSDHGL